MFCSVTLKIIEDVNSSVTSFRLEYKLILYAETSIHFIQIDIFSFYCKYFTFIVTDISYERIFRNIVSSDTRSKACDHSNRESRPFLRRGWRTLSFGCYAIPWIWRKHFHGWASTKFHGVSYQKTGFIIVCAVRITNLILCGRVRNILHSAYPAFNLIVAPWAPSRQNIFCLKQPGRDSWDFWKLWITVGKDRTLWEASNSAHLDSQCTEFQSYKYCVSVFILRKDFATAQ
jgi:hypothetical protein